MCSTLTDNRNRTAPEIKKIFERAGGNLGAPNCVGWMFNKKGMIVVPASSTTEEQLMDIALEAGADDIEQSDDIFEITCEPAAFQQVKAALDSAEVTCSSADLSMLPTNTVRVDDSDAARKILSLMETLDDHDDVQSVSANFDIDDEILAAL